MPGADLAIVLRLIDEATGPMKTAAKGVTGFSDSLEKTGKAISKTGLQMSILSAPLLAIGVDAVKTAADFEGSMNMLQSVTHGTGEQMAQLSAKAKELGADITLPATSATDAGEAMLELSKAGLTVTDTMAAAKGVLQLSAAAQVSNARAAEIAANALNMFNLPGEKASNVANLLANAANAASGEVTDMADALAMSGSIFSSMQGPAVGAEQSLTDLTTAIGLLAVSGIKGSDAGTGLKQALLQLVNASQPSQAAMKGLELAFRGVDVSQVDMSEGSAKVEKALAAAGKASGVAGVEMASWQDLIYDSTGKMLPFKEILLKINAATKDWTQAQRDQTIAQIFGSDATTKILPLLRSLNKVNEEGVDAWDEMATAVTRSGGAAEVADARMHGLNGALQGLQSAWETLLLNVAEPFLGFMTDVVKKVVAAVAWFQDLPDPVKKTALAIGAIIAVAGPLILILGAMATAVSAIATVLPIVGIALAALTGPVGLAVLAIAGLVALFVIFKDDILQSGFAQGIRDIAGAFNNLKSALSGIKFPSMPSGFRLPSFAEGGIVPGPIGAPMLAMVHGGEQVLTPGQQASGGGGVTSANITVVLDGQVVGRAAWNYMKIQKRNGSVMGL